jgi:heat shock protein HslJ
MKLARVLSVIGIALMILLVTTLGRARALDPVLTNGPWRVVEIEVNRALHDKTVKFEGSKILGKSVCNYISAYVAQTNGKLENHKALNHSMPCGKDRVAAERRYLDAFADIHSYVVRDDSLLLVDDDGRVVFRLKK